MWPSYNYAPDKGPEDMTFGTRGMRAGDLDAMLAMTAANPDIFHKIFSPAAPSLAPHNTASATAGLTTQARTWPGYVQYLHPLGIRNIAGVSFRPISPEGLHPPFAGDSRPSRLNHAFRASGLESNRRAHQRGGPCASGGGEARDG